MYNLFNRLLSLLADVSLADWGGDAWSDEDEGAAWSVQASEGRLHVTLQTNRDPHRPQSGGNFSPHNDQNLAFTKTLSVGYFSQVVVRLYLFTVRSGYFGCSQTSV